MSIAKIKILESVVIFLAGVVVWYSFSTTNEPQKILMVWVWGFALGQAVTNFVKPK